MDISLLKYIYFREKPDNKRESCYEIGHEYGSVDGSVFDCDLIGILKGDTTIALAEKLRRFQREGPHDDISLKNLDSMRVITKVRSGLRDISIVRPLTSLEMLGFTEALGNISPRSSA